MPTPSDYYDPGSNPPPTPGTLITNGGIPGVTANRARGTATPLARQLVAAGVNPPNAATTDPSVTPTAPGTVPPPASPGENINDPTPGDYKPGGYTPVPWKPPPPAGPAPPPGNWDHENEQPGWLRPAPLTGRPPNRDPDGYLNGRPIWNARPGEQGYDAVGSNALSGIVAKLESDYGRANAAQPASMANKTYGQYPGFVATYGSGPQGVTNYAKALLQYNPNATLGDFYAGYAQGTGNPAHPPTLADMQAHYPAYYNNLIKNSPYPINTPLASLIGGTVAGPVQQYIPPQPREASDWGRPPENDWTPGRMPTSHDIPNILGALLPIAIAGLLGGGGLGMIAAYTGYQNARNKGQLEEAKEARTRWRDQLAETEAGLKSELLESSNLMAEYGGDITSPAAKQAWMELAGKYQDPYLRAAIESGNSAAIQELFKKRDEAFQSISKVSAATTKADEQEQQKEADQKTEAAWGVPGAQQPSSGGAGTPPGPEKPWENLGPGFAGGGQPAAPPSPPGGGPGAGAQPGGASAPPAAASAPSQQPPASEEPPPGPETPSPPQPPGSEPQPAAAPAPPAAPRSVFDELVSEGVNGQDIEKFKAGAPKDMLPKLQGAIAQKNAQIDAVQPGPNAAAQLAAIDPNFADYVTGVSRYTAQLPSPRANTGRDFSTRVQAAAKKINPQWNAQNYDKQKEFANSNSTPQKRLSRAAPMGEASANVMKAAKDLQDAGIEVTQDAISEAIDRAVNKLSGDPKYMAIANAILAFTQEDQALRTAGTPSVTETEAQAALVSGHVFLGSLEAIRTYVKQNIDTAAAAVTYYQHQWDQMQGYGTMPGTDPDANAIIGAMQYLDPKTGQYHMPKGTQLPPVLVAGIPEHAPPPTLLPKPGSTTAPAPTPQQGGGNAPPQPAVDFLKAHPEFRQQFDQKYGAGAAARALGQ